MPTVWLGAPTIGYPRGGGHLWVYLNWALSLRAVGCEVVWLDLFDLRQSTAEQRAALDGLRSRLEPYGLEQAIAMHHAHASLEDERLIPPEAAREADLLLNLGYDAFHELRPYFSRSALLDIDPGLTQLWSAERIWDLSGFGAYFTIGEAVATGAARSHDDELGWRYVPPAVALDHWPVAPSTAGAAFTTVSHWSSSRRWFSHEGETFCNDKRSGFLPLLDLPRHTDQRLELALALAADEDLRLAPEEESEKQELERQGWSVVHAHAVAGTPWDYQRYISSSKGEFACARPSYTVLQTGWISDRTACYLASGKPVVVQHTGPSRSLPDDAGMFRFRDREEAISALARVGSDYERQCRLARSLAEEVFDGRAAAERVLADALS